MRFTELASASCSAWPDMIIDCPMKINNLYDELNMDVYTFEDGKTLRCGYTTGTTAAMAALSSARLLLTGEKLNTVSVMTPKGIAVSAKVEVSELCRYSAGDVSGAQPVQKSDYTEPLYSEGCMPDNSGGEKRYAVAAVRKDGGDDIDKTNGLLIYARTELKDEPGVIIEAGEGIGIVTKPGLSVPVGKPAINPVPRRMIEEALTGELMKSGTDKGIICTIYVPDGKKTAEYTFNPNLGIKGGISIIGTSGIVEPMSKKAWAEAVRLEIRQKAALGNRKIILTPGNYGLDFIKELFDAVNLAAIPQSSLHKHDPEEIPVKDLSKQTSDRTDAAFFKRASADEMADAPVVVCSNFIGEAIDETISDDFEKVFIIGHAGKLVKLAGGIMNTHSGMADCRMELICAHAAICGADTQTCRQIMELTTTDAAFSFLEDRSQELRTKVIGSLYRKIEYHLGERVRKHEKDSSIRIEAVMFVKHDGRNILL